MLKTTIRFVYYSQNEQVIEFPLQVEEGEIAKIGQLYFSRFLNKNKDIVIIPCSVSENDLIVSHRDIF